MSCSKSNCVIALGLTIMDRCPECEKIETAAKEEERITQNAASAANWSRDYAEMGRVSNKRPLYVQHTETAGDSGDIHAIDAGPSGESARSVASLARTIQRLKTKELASYSHGESPQLAREHDAECPDDAVFFVSCIEDEGEHRRLMLLGPYDTHAEALGNVDRGRKLAEQDPKAHWYYFGTCSMAKDTEVKGVLGK